MINKTNFWIGLAAAVLIAAALLGARESVVAWAADAGLGNAFFGAPLSDPLLMASIAVALGTMAWMIIGWAVPLIGLEAQIGAAIQDDADPNEESFTVVNEKLGGSLMPRFPAEPGTVAAPTVTGSSLLNQYADAWFFRALPLAALGLGALIAVLSLIHSRPASAGNIEGALYEALDLAAPTSSTVALGCFVTAASGAFFAALIYWLTSGSAAAQLDRLIAATRARLLGTDAYRLEYRIAEALAPVADALTAAAEKLSDAQERISQAAIEKACTRFLASLEQASGVRTEALAGSISALERSASSLLSAVEQTEKRLTAAHEAQSAQTSESFSAALHALQQQQAEQASALQNELRALANELRAMTEAAVQTLTEQASQASAATQQTLNLLAQESGRTATITQAAEQMDAAARASRETVERFIALAERMRDLSQSLTLASGAPVQFTDGPGGTPATAAPTLKRIDPPLTSPETTKRLSSAIRNLKQAVNEPLPEL